MSGGSLSGGVAAYADATLKTPLDCAGVKSVTNDANVPSRPITRKPGRRRTRGAAGSVG